MTYFWVESIREAQYCFSIDTTLFSVVTVTKPTALDLSRNC